MKFEYGVEKDRGECVAYITKNTCGDTYLVINSEYAGCVHLSRFGVGKDGEWEPDQNHIVKKFYKGDKVTIMF